MPTFVFRLEPVLKQRKLEEERCQRELAQVLRERGEMEGEIRGMQSTISQSRQSLGYGLVGKVNMDQVSHFARYSMQVRSRAELLVLKLAGVEQQVHEARQRLIEATRARKALELLRDKQFEAWRREQERREVAEADDLVTQRYARRRQSSAEPT